MTRLQAICCVARQKVKPDIQGSETEQFYGSLFSHVLAVVFMRTLLYNIDGIHERKQF